MWCGATHSCSAALPSVLALQRGSSIFLFGGEFVDVQTDKVHVYKDLYRWAACLGSCKHVWLRMRLTGGVRWSSACTWLHVSCTDRTARWNAQCGPNHQAAV